MKNIMSKLDENSKLVEIGAFTACPWMQPVREDAKR